MNCHCQICLDSISNVAVTNQAGQDNLLHCADMTISQADSWQPLGMFIDFLNEDEIRLSCQPPQQRCPHGRPWQFVALSDRI